MRPSLLPALAGLAGALFSAAVLRRGVVLGPDSWAYWEGSVSLLQFGRYSYFGGEPIATFPPLFSLTLALGQAALGVSVRTLAVTLAALSAMGSFAWTMLFRILRGRPATTSWPDVLAALYVPATLAVYAQVLLSEALWLVLLPLFLLVVMAPLPRSPARRVARAAAAWLTLAGLLLCRNVTVAVLPGGVLLWLRMEAGSALARRLSTALAITAAALIPWYWVRGSLGQLAYHPLGTAREGILAHSKRMLAGMAYAFGPDQWGMGATLLTAAAILLCWDMAARRGPRRADPLLALAVFAIMGLAGLVALFGATHVGVGEPLGGRYVVFAALALVLVILGSGRWPQAPLRARGLMALGVALTAIALYRVGIKCRLAGREQPVQAFNVMINSSYWTGPPRVSGDYVLVAPPTYPWLQRSGLR